MAYVSVHVDLDEFDDDELIDELESRGYKVFDKDGDVSPKPIQEPIQTLYTTFQTMDRDYFEKELKKFFRDTLDVNEY